MQFIHVLMLHYAMFVICSGAMSLRRQYIRKLTKGSASFFTSRNMGDAQQANCHAENFERAAEVYLRQQLVLLQQDEGSLITEAQLKAKKLPMTPDFLFRDNNVQINGVAIKWIVSVLLLFLRVLI
jgi:hypothetical protein